jgi:hypothetical protein
MGVVSSVVNRRGRCLVPLLLCGALSACTGANPWFQPGKLGPDGGERPDSGRAAGGTGGSVAGGTGGAPGTGGANSSGGASGSGGGSGAGGVTGSGGAGGTSGTGGSSSTGGTGGAAGAATGGTGGTGGAASGGTGGTGGGGAGGAGGTGGTGGAAGGTGGSGTGGSGADAAGDTAGVGTPPAACGSQTSQVTGISGAKSIAVDRDGIIYYTRESGGRAYIGRILPGGTAEPTWYTVAAGGQPVMGSTPRMLRTHRQRGYLLVADPGLQGGKAFTLNIAGPTPTVVQSTSAIAGIHGLAIATDGSVFISGADGHVDRWMPDPYTYIFSRVSTAPIFPAGQRVLGLAFGLDGQLFMGSSNGGIKRARVVQMSATDFRLMDVVDHGSFIGAANDLAVDVDGRVYVADHTGTTRTRLAIVPPGGVGPVQRIDAILGRLSGLAFGRGNLQCDDLYVTDLDGPAFRYDAGRLVLDLP